MVALGIAMVEGVARIRRWATAARQRATRFAVGLAVRVRAGRDVRVGTVPIGDEYNAGYWPLPAATRRRRPRAG